ncbi:MAG: hypothetical protein KGS61_05080 [Verrucomicrobia bacterium]|nr:hypothetical protein [Verrucomicrobiota bacterium]
MEPQSSKFRLQEQRQAAAQQQSGQQQAGLEFATAEELLRHDAAQVTPPPTLRQRLHLTLRGQKPVKRRWWHRLFARNPTEP